jgi:signal transduction histidine kinase/CHASE3 domain sensor protein
MVLGQTVRRITGLLMLGAALSVVIVTAILSYRDGVAFERVNEQREISERNALLTANLLELLTDAETGQRGFLLTGREYYLDPYKRAVREVPEVLQRLTVSTANRRDQVGAAITLKSLIQEKFDELKQTIDLYRSGGADAAVAKVRTDQGNNVMIRIRQVCGEIEAAASNRVIQQSKEAQLSRERTHVVIGAGDALLLTLLTIAMLTINRARVRQQNLIETLQYSERRTQTHLARLDLLGRITRAVGERQDLESIFQVVIGSLEDQLPIDFGCICLYDALTDSLSIASLGAKSQTLGLDPALMNQDQISVGRNGLARCVRGQLIYEPEIGTLEFSFASRLSRSGLRSLVMAPLPADDEVFGVLLVARTQANAFASGDCEFLRQLSEHVALAAHQAQIKASLQRAYDDLRQTQQAMMAQERLRALGQMASGIAHDINNALSPIAMSTELLLTDEPNLSATVRRYLEITQRCVHDIAETTKRLSEISWRREHPVALAPVNLNCMVEQVLDLTRVRWVSMAHRQGVVIESRTDLAPDLPVVMGIESEIREAIINLVFNAVDAMPHGGTLTVRTRANRSKQNSEWPGSVHLEVQDTGVGMDEETRQRCVEPFFTTKGERGTGLGLAMVAGIASRNDAEVEIDSEPGKGTTVRLSFPEATVEQLEPAQVFSVTSPLRILTVDDDPLIRQTLRALLEGDGHVVATADGGQSGIDAFKLAEGGEPYDVVITDLGMPEVDGRRVASAVKAVRPSVPVILLTGWGQQLSEDSEAPPHVDRVLGKPPRLRELRAALGE